jgi:hypothetical protein
MFIRRYISLATSKLLKSLIAADVISVNGIPYVFSTNENINLTCLNDVDDHIMVIKVTKDIWYNCWDICHETIQTSDREWRIGNDTIKFYKLVEL